MKRGPWCLFIRPAARVYVNLFGPSSLPTSCQHRSTRASSSSPVSASVSLADRGISSCTKAASPPHSFLSPSLQPGGFVCAPTSFRSLMVVVPKCYPGTHRRGVLVWDSLLLSNGAPRRVGGALHLSRSWTWGYERGEGGWGGSVLLLKLLPLPPSVWAPRSHLACLSSLSRSPLAHPGLSVTPSQPFLSRCLSAAALAVWIHNSAGCRARGSGSLSNHPGRKESQQAERRNVEEGEMIRFVAWKRWK